VRTHNDDHHDIEGFLESEELYLLSSWKYYGFERFCLKHFLASPI